MEQHIYQVLEVLEEQVVVEMVVNIPITQLQQMAQLTLVEVEVVMQGLQILQAVQESLSFATNFNSYE